MNPSIKSVDEEITIGDYCLKMDCDGDYLDTAFPATVAVISPLSSYVPLPSHPTRWSALVKEARRTDSYIVLARGSSWKKISASPQLEIALIAAYLRNWEPYE